MSGSGAQSRWWIAGGVLVAVLLAAASWLLLVGPKLDDAASVRDQTRAASDQNSILQIKVNKLRADSASMPDLLHQLDTLHAQLPTTSGLDALTRQLTGDAAQSGVTVTSIVIGVPTAVTVAAAAAGAASDAADTVAEPDEATGDAPSPTSSAAAPAVAQHAADGTLYAIPVTISSTGRLADQRDLLHAIQAQGPRGALVSSVQLAPAPEAADRPGGEPGDARSSGAAGTSGVPTGGPRASGTAEREGSVEPTGSAGDGPADAAEVTTQPGGPAAADATAVTMTVQLAVFVAPQTPQDEAALRKQLGG